MIRFRRRLDRMAALATFTLAAMVFLAAGAQAVTGSVAVTPWASKVVFGESSRVVGTTSPARPGGRVALERRVEGGRWSTRNIGFADATGRFEIAFQPTSVGIYALRVRTTVGYSRVFYLRVLPPIVLDPGGMQGLRLGMTFDAALATHWIESHGGSCTGASTVASDFYGVFRPDDLMLPDPHIDVLMQFGGKDHTLSWLRLEAGSTVEGVRWLDPASKIEQTYRGPTYNVSKKDNGPGTGGPPGEHSVTYTVSRANRTVYQFQTFDGKIEAVIVSNQTNRC